MERGETAPATGKEHFRGRREGDRDLAKKPEKEVPKSDAQPQKGGVVINKR